MGLREAHRRHHERHHRRRRLGLMGQYVRASLRRRLFLWFIMAIVSTVVLTSLTWMLISKVDQSPWSRQMDRGVAWVGGQFAPTWADPAQRHAFAVETATALGLELRLLDANGNSLDSVGNADCGRHALMAPVRTATGVLLGSVAMCSPHPPGLLWRLPLGLLIFGLVLWRVAGKMATRLARPLDELTDVVKRIGAGDLSARTQLGCYEPGEIGIVSDAVNDMASRIEKQLADQRELLATVSHELRTPLARVRIISEIARDTGATPKTFDDLDREVVEMDSLVGQLLASSRVDFGVITKRELSVKDVALRAVERGGMSTDVVCVEGEPGVIEGDATLLQRALANLFDNAKKHAGGFEQLHVARVGSEVKFEVLDRGPGLKNGDGAALFEKFKQSEGDGLGLGLALVRRIALAHGGRVWAENREGGGARIGFSVAATADAKQPLLTEEQLRKAQDEQRRTGVRIGTAVISTGAVKESTLNDFLARQYGVPAINLPEFEIQPDIIKLVPRAMAEEHLVIPVNRSGKALVVAMCDPSNLTAVDALHSLTGLAIEPVVTSEPSLRDAIGRYYQA